MKTFLFILWSLAGLSASVWGQQYMSQEGRMLDANNRIGSFGLNASVPTNTLAPRINNYITGNVTGGARFQGLVPYSSPYEINTSMGSSTLSDFRRDSTGLNNVRAPRLQGPQAYVDPSRSVSGSYGGYIGQTGNLPMSIPSSQYAVGSSLNQELSNRPLSYSAYSPLTRSEFMEGESDFQMMKMPGNVSKQYEPWMAGASALKPAGLGELPADEAEKTSRSGGAYVNPAFNNQTSLIKPPTEAKTAAETAAAPTPFEQQTGEMSNALTPSAETKAAGLPADLTRPGQAERTAPPDAQAAEQPTADAQFYTDPKTQALSANQQRFEHYMQLGYQLIGEQRYYQAVDAFATAGIYQSKDARAMLGKAYALFAAGEFMSSAYYLEQAINHDERLASQRAPVDKLFAVPEDYQKRLEDIDRWQNRTENANLAFLHGYLRFATGDDVMAKELLTKAIRPHPDYRAAQLILAAIEGQKAKTGQETP